VAKQTLIFSLLLLSSDTFKVPQEKTIYLMASLKRNISSCSSVPLLRRCQRLSTALRRERKAARKWWC